MKKLLIITNRISLSGSTIHVLELVKFIAKYYDVRVIAGTLEPEEESALHLFEAAGITPLIIKEMVRSVSFSKDRTAYKRLKHEISIFQPDIVHTHTSKAGALGRMAAHSKGVKNIIHTFHGTIFEGHFDKLKSLFYLLAERYLAKFSNSIIALSQSQNEDLVSKYRIAKASKVVTIPLGLSLGHYTRDLPSKRDKFRKEFSISKDVFTIGIIGRLVKIKDHFLFVDTIKKVKELVDTPIKGLIIGDGEERRSISKYILDKEMSFSTSGTGDIVFTSWRLDMDVVLAGIDLVLVTSINEGTPVCIIEGQASGVPIVSVSVGGIKDIVTEDSTILCQERSSHCLSTTIAEVIKNEDLKLKLSLGGIKQSKMFTIDNMIEKMVKLYEINT